MGNIEFEPNAKEGCDISNATENEVDFASELLGIDSDELAQQLTTRIMTTTKRNEIGTVYTVGLKPSEAVNSRNSFVKIIYSRLFDEIVAIINRSIPFNDSVNRIGILDIAGFGRFFRRDLLELFRGKDSRFQDSKNFQEEIFLE